MNDETLSGFAVEIDGTLLADDGNDAGLVAADDGRVAATPDGTSTRSTTFRHARLGVEITRRAATFPGLDVVESWVEVRNAGDRDVRVTRVDSVRGTLPVDEYTLRSFTSGWGQEFTPADGPLRGTKILEVTSGRSSQGLLPWFALEGKSGHAIVGAVAWSGNWIVRFEPRPGANAPHVLSAGLSNWEFEKLLKPGQSMEGARVLHVSLVGGTVADAALQLQRWGRRHGYATNPLSRSMPVEWNHWWPYEDAEITEAVFSANAAEAAKLGFEVTTLDAGWFGGDAGWYDVRGDWDRVNATRFPAGLAKLSEDVRGRGLRFGLWCEIEAVGKSAELAKRQPDLVATRGGQPIGYVCMGNPRTVDWAFGTLDRLIREYGLSWVKLDFNLDPGAGCDRADHGHGRGDGLYEHVRGYYALLDRVRAAHPDVLLENCSSGGLRIDLGILRHSHATFLSDPDYTEHSLQLAWGAAQMLHPSVCLRWPWSHTRPSFTPNRVNDPITAETPPHKFDYIVRAAMLGVFGCSYRLPDLPAAWRDRLKQHIAFYKEHVRDLLRDGDFYPLTGQVLRTGGGDRWNAFLSVADDKRRAIGFVFRLPGGDDKRTIPLRGLDPATRYTVTFRDGGGTSDQAGAALMRDGLTFEAMPPESAEIVLLAAR